MRSAQLVFKVTDRDELDKLVAGDPYSIHGLVASSTVNLWNVEVGSMEKPATPDADGTKYFRATYELNADCNPNECKKERKAYLTKLLEDKKLRASGTYENNSLAGLSILSVPTAEEALAIMMEDPYVKILGASYQVIEWNPKFGEFK